MNIRFRIFIVMVLTINIDYTAFAQWTVHNSISTGETINEPRAIRGNSVGEVWIGTKESGVASYDGTSWNYYDINNAGFPNNYIRTLYSFGANVWVGTGFNGAGEYNGSWSTKNRANTSNGLADDEVLGLDHDGNVYLWYATYNGLSVDSITKWRTYTTLNSIGMPTNQLKCIKIDGQNNKWIGTDGFGLLKFNANVWTSYKTDNSPLPSNTINKIAIAPNGNLWICTANGLAEFDGASYWKIYSSSITPTITSNVFNDVAIDNSGNIVLATNDGVLTRSAAGGWARYHSGNSSIPENTITCVGVDNSTYKAWAGTLSSGLAEADMSTVLSNQERIGFTDASVSVYPNPVAEELNITVQFSSYTMALEISLCDLSGMEYFNIKENDSQIEFYKKAINTSSFAAGFYLLRISTPEGLVVKKIIKY